MMASIASDPEPEAAPTAVPDLAATYRDQYRSLVRLASILLDEVEACEEVVQDAFVQVWQRGPVLRSPERLPAYLRSAVLNGARSQLRRRAVAGRHLAAVPDPAPAAEAAALAGDADDAVLTALRGLPDRQREVLALRYYLDLSEAEIAATLGISAGSVKTHASRGLATLADRLEDQR